MHALTERLFMDMIVQHNRWMIISAIATLYDFFSLEPSALLTHSISTALARGIRSLEPLLSLVIARCERETVYCVGSLDLGNLGLAVSIGILPRSSR